MRLSTEILINEARLRERVESMAAAILSDILQPRLGKCWNDTDPECIDNTSDDSYDWDPTRSKLFVNNIQNAPLMYQDAGLRLRVLVIS